MKRIPRARSAAVFVALAMISGILPLLLSAAAPEWWTEKGIYKTKSDGSPETALDHAAANQGQLKNIAVGAYEHLRTTLPSSLSIVGDSTPDGPRARIRRLIEGWIKLDPSGVPLRDQAGQFIPQDDPALKAGVPSDYSMASLGQLKAVAEPFHARLTELIPSSNFAPRWHTPWTDTEDDDQSHAAANLGQVKHVFGFDARKDSDRDGVSDIEEANLEVFNGGLQVLPPIINAVTLVEGGRVRIDFQFQNRLASMVSIQRKSAAYGGVWVEVGRYPVQGDQTDVNQAWTDVDIWREGQISYRMQTYYAYRWSQDSDEANVEVVLTDTDADGLPDAFEQLAGTDPTNSDDADDPFWDTFSYSEAYEGGVRPDVPLTTALQGWGPTLPAPTVSVQEQDAEDVDLRKIRVNWSGEEGSTIKLIKLFETHSDENGWRGAAQGPTGAVLRNGLLSNRTYSFRVTGINSRTNEIVHSSVTPYEVPVVRGVLRRGQHVAYKFPGHLSYPAQGGNTATPQKYGTATGQYSKQRSVSRTLSGTLPGSVASERSLELLGKPAGGANVEPLEWKVQFDLNARTATVTVDSWLDWERHWETRVGQGETLLQNLQGNTSEGYIFTWSNADNPHGNFSADYTLSSSLGANNSKEIDGSWTFDLIKPIYSGAAVTTWSGGSSSSPFPQNSTPDGRFGLKTNFTLQGSASIDNSSSTTSINSNPPPPATKVTSTETIGDTFTLSEPITTEDLLKAMLESGGAIQNFGWFNPGGSMSALKWGGAKPTEYAIEPASGSGGSAYYDPNRSITYSDISVPSGGSFEMNADETETSFSESEVKVRFYPPARPTFVVVPVETNLPASGAAGAVNKQDYDTFPVVPEQTESPSIHAFGTSVGLVAPPRTVGALQLMRKGSVSIGTPTHVPVELVPMYQGRRHTPGGYTFSFPSPIVELEPISDGQIVSGVNGLVATLNLKGMVTSDQCNLLPATAGGVISNSKAYINGSTEPIALALDVTKEVSNSPDTMPSMPFVGVLDSTIQVPVLEGVNTIKVTATEPTHQIDGFDTWSFRVVSQVDADGSASYTITDPQRIDQSRGGHFDPWMLRVRGGLDAHRLKDLWRIELPNLGLGQLPLMVGRADFYGNGFLYARRLDAEVPLTFTFRPNFGGSLQSGAFLGTTPTALDDNIEFAIGFKEGMVAGGVQMVADAQSVGVFAATIGAVFGAQVRILAKSALGYGAAEMEEEFNVLEFARPDIEDAIDGTTEFLAKLGNHTLNTLEAVGNFELALITGNYAYFEERFVQASEFSAEMFDTFAEVLTAVYESVEGMPPRQKGKIVGRATFEIGSIFVPGAAAAKVTKAEWWRRLFARPSFANSAEFGAVAQKLTPLLADLQTTKMCFVPGTPVWTEKGPVPIEALAVGDFVLAADEISGRQELRRITRTITTTPEALVVVQVRGPSGEAGDERITCTAGHPFYVRRGMLVEPTPAGELRAGDLLAQKDGASLMVLDLRANLRVPENLVTYNLEVEDFHTYFVGVAGLWVHNQGRAFCEKLKSLFGRFLANANNDVWAAHKASVNKLDSLVGLDPRLQSTEVARVQIFTEARRRHFDDLPSANPPWRNLAQQQLTLTNPPADNQAMAAELRANMEKALQCNPEGHGFAAHHIVAHGKQGPDWDRARATLSQAGVHLNEAANGVFIPHTRAAAEAYPSLGKVHGSFHSDAIAKTIADRLGAVSNQGANALRDELQKIANDISNGILP